MDDTRIDQLIENVRRDAGGAFISGLGYIGDRLGMFIELAKCGRATSGQLAERLDLNERYVREWLKAMTAFGYIEHAAGDSVYWMEPEQIAVLADEGTPCFAAGTFQFTLPSLRHTDALLECFRAGGGIAYEDLGDEIPRSIERMHRPWFDHLLTGTWLPAIGEIHDGLESGVSVLDVGCGTGRSTVAIARAHARSTVVGVDPHTPSIEAARQLGAGLANVSFIEGTLDVIQPPAAFDVVVAIDCIHDMHDPIGALRSIAGVLAPDGVLLWSEPTGSADPTQNRDSQGRLRQALSTYHCLTVSLASGGAGLGTLIGESGARAMAAEAGFGSFQVYPVESAAQAFYGVRP